MSDFLRPGQGTPVERSRDRHRELNATPPMTGAEVLAWLLTAEGIAPREKASLAKKVIDANPDDLRIKMDGVKIIAGTLPQLDEGMQALCMGYVARFGGHKMMVQARALVASTLN